MIFTDPVLRAPLVASMLMCLSSALIGVFVFLKRRSLAGETLSHAAYPGVIFGALLATAFGLGERGVGLGILFGAFTAICLAQGFLSQLVKKLRVADDAALTFTLAGFFGLGVLGMSKIQLTHGGLFRLVQTFLFGQAATMRDEHILVYGILTFFVVGVIFFFFRPLSILHFDRLFAVVVGVRITALKLLFSFLLALAIAIGMRSVGVVLMSAMLVAPALAARAWTDRLSSLLILSGCIGIFSGLGGNLLSIQLPLWLGLPRLTLSTGPMIVLVATAIVLFSLLFSPQRGWCVRKIKVALFRQRCLQENILKALPQTVKTLRERLGASRFQTLIALHRLKWKGWVRRDLLALTPKGEIMAKRLIRLHRLWEVYLVHMGQDIKLVHRSAEEMEHILTPEVEAQLVALLNDPTHDPHLQPIPERVS